MICSDVKVSNIVCTARVTTPVYLQLIVQKHPFCEYNRCKFAAVTLRLYNPSATCLIFASGKIVCTGSSSLHDTRAALLTGLKLIRECGYHEADLRDFHVENLVASLSWPFGVCLEALHACYPNETSYERGLFPGLIWRPYSENVGVFLVFATGRCVLTGCTTLESLQASRNWFISRFNEALSSNSFLRIRLGETSDVDFT